jgi:aminopeptidase N
MALATTARASVSPIDDERIYLYHAKHYDLSMDFDFLRKSFSGRVVMTAKTQQPMSEIVLSAARASITIDAVIFENKQLSFRQDSENVIASLPSLLGAQQEFTVALEYHGSSNGRGQYQTGGIIIDVVDGLGRVATNSEPYYARTWWPCKDVPDDKATFSAHITVPSNLLALSNGLEKERQRRMNFTTYNWETKYPTATYLVAVLVGNYKEFSDTYVGLDGKKMKILYYVFPEDFQKARVDFQDTPQILKFFASTFCEYPFIDEKFAYVEVNGNLTMENQTICTIEDRLISGDKHYQSTLVHEAAHHWWGNLLTPSGWTQSWLNEGFATYAEALYLEHSRGESAYHEYMDGIMDSKMGRYAGSVIGLSDTSYGDAFSSRVYDKGAAVLHMLRHVMGDDKFFSAMRNYVNNPTFRYANVTTDDFEQECDSAYGSSLKWFFAEWVYAHTDSIDRPQYVCSYTSTKSGGSNGYNFRLDIAQETSSQLVFRMPLTITANVQNKSESSTFIDSAATQTYTFHTSGFPESIDLDKDKWVLKVLKMRRSNY